MQTRFPLILLAACSSSPPSGPPTTITVTSDRPLLVAAFRDGPTGPWRDATMTSPTTYEIVVHGPYVFGAVYDSGLPDLPLYNFDEHARTLDDDLTFAMTTPIPSGTRSMINGTMVQPGAIAIDDELGGSQTPNWDFALSAAPAVHDLFAMTTDHVLIQRGVDATHDVAVGSLDATARGVALDTVAFTADQTPSETLTTATFIETPTTAIVRVGAFGTVGDPNATKVIPAAILVPTDRQTVSVRATDGGHFRALRRPFHTGASTAYMLPTLLNGVSWSDSPEPSVSWTSVAPGQLDAATSAITGTARGYEAFLTPSFIQATGAKRFTFDTHLPGFEDAWRIDTAQPHDHNVLVQVVDDAADIVQSQSEDEMVGSAPVIAAPMSHPRGMVEP